MSYLITPPEIILPLGPFGTVAGERNDDTVDDLWMNRVWLHLRYGADQRKYMTRMVNHFRGTAFVKASVESKLFQDYVFDHATGVLFIEGRVALIDNQTREPDLSSASPRALVAYGEEDALALRQSDIKGTYLWVNGSAAHRTGERRLA